ncbi:MAG TPA: mannose-6-phosphate isomerase, class I [Polyangiaceae bacterium]|nr:mannose-6-phosphate isomerase, class I [Polyangiaceae bacterium]
MTALFPLENRIQNYAWGSRRALAELSGRAAPTEVPEAELWMGAHPLACSRAGHAAGPTLLELIASAPVAMLGERVAKTYGKLPFLMKLLAAAEPLSLQAHPSEAQARAGYDREEAAGVPLTAPTRSYKDPHHKPELICALTPFSALVGFRPTRDTAHLFAALGVPDLTRTVHALRHEPAPVALHGLFELVTRSSAEARRELADTTLAACRARRDSVSDFSAELAWGVRIGELYPGDAGIVLALALNLVVLEPGEAVYLPAGNLHAYLEGTGVEIMASSDNVLRGGLTPKHVDAAELLRVLDFHAEPVRLVATETHGSLVRYITPAREFDLSRLELTTGELVVDAVSGPEIVVVTRGELTLRRADESTTLAAGASVFVPAAGGAYTIAGAGTAFRARVNDA